MDTARARKDALAARQELENGDPERARELIDQVVGELSPDSLLTTNEAKDVLGIRSVNTLKALVRKAGLRTVMRGNRMMIPLSELEQIQESEMVRRIRASDRLHAESAELGSDDGLSEEELDALDAGRPGTLPWKAGKPVAT